MKDLHIRVRVDKKFLHIPLNTIIYLQSCGNYVKVFTTEKTYLCASTTNDMEKELDSKEFRRVHRCYIIALKKVLRTTETEVIMGDKIQIPIGKTFKHELLHDINSCPT